MQKLKYAFDVVAATWKRSLGDMRFLYDGELTCCCQCSAITGCAIVSS